MKYTSNLSLLKPEGSDVYDIEHMNENADILDKEISQIYNVVGGENGSAIENIKKNIRFIKNYTIEKSKWELMKDTDMYRYSVKSNLITKDSVMNVNVDIQDLEQASTLYSATDAQSGVGYIYSRNIPTTDILCDITIIKEVL